MMKKLLLGAVALVIGLGGFWWTQHDHVAAAPMPSASGAAVLLVAGLWVARNMPLYVVGLGTVQPYNTVTVRSRVDGQIMKALFTEGQEVKAGDPLFQIDPRPSTRRSSRRRPPSRKTRPSWSARRRISSAAPNLLNSGFSPAIL